MLRIFYLNITGCVGISADLFETIVITSLKENIETPFECGILPSFTEFQCQGTDTFSSI